MSSKDNFENILIIGGTLLLKTRLKSILKQEYSVTTVHIDRSNFENKLKKKPYPQLIKYILGRPI